MAGEKALPEDGPLPSNALGDKVEAAQLAVQGGGHRIQFIPTAKPERGRTVTGKEDALSFIASTHRRSISAHSIPQVVSEKEKKRRKSEQEEEKKHVDSKQQGSGVPVQALLGANPLPTHASANQLLIHPYFPVDEHLMSHHDVADRYKSRIDMAKPEECLGLTSEQADQLLRDHGPNILTPPKKRSAWLKYLDCLSSLFNLLLILAGILENILLGISYKNNFQNTYLGAILIIVANLNAFIEFYQQQKSQKILESFLNMIPAKYMCLRDGKLAQREASYLVPGDVVYVRMGDKTPADLLVFSASDCNVDNSSLTGESEPQERMKDNDMNNPLEASNLMFNSTLVVSGEAYGIVIRTGDGTVLGQITTLTTGEESTTSLLTHQIDNFVKMITTITNKCSSQYTPAHIERI